MLDISMCLTVVPPHPWGNEIWFDDTKQPWHYDPDFGVVMAWPEEGHGDGAYVYGRVVNGKLTVLPNPRHDQMDARRIERTLHSFRRVQARVAAEHSA